LGAVEGTGAEAAGIASGGAQLRLRRQRRNLASGGSTMSDVCFAVRALARLFIPLRRRV